MYKTYFKRAFDFFSAFFGFLLLLPIFLLVMLFLAFANQGKPFFFQARPGKNGKIFKIIKFKTMNDKRGKDGELLSDEKRLTKVGAFVRKTSLDEIPQLLNILKGDMSLIGPRPLLPSYLAYYNEAEMERLTIRPGITGLTGVSGRNNLSWYDKMKFDIQYVKELDASLDFKIFLLTIKKVLVRDGVAKDGFVTTDTFIDFCEQNPIRHYDFGNKSEGSKDLNSNQLS